MPKRVDPVQRYWDRVDRRGSDECWPWLGSVKKHSGHGRLWFRGVQQSAHQVALILAGSPRPAPPRNCALHSCDNPICQNPAHLRWGTQAENIEDRQRRGRAWRKLHARDIERILALRGRLPQAKIASMFGVSQGAISNVHRTGKGTSMPRRVSPGASQ